MIYHDDFTDREITDELSDAVKRYEEIDPQLFFYNFINDTLTNEQVIQRLDEAIADKESIERNDKTFWKADYLQ